MKARLKDNKYIKVSKRFKDFLKVTKKDYRKNRVQLENGEWYNRDFLEFKKESGGRRYKGLSKMPTRPNIVEIDLDKVNTNLKIGEYEKEIEALNKECESWQQSYQKEKKEKEELSYQLSKITEKRNFWMIWFIAYFILDIGYAIIKLLGIL